MKVCHSDSADVFANLALEDLLLDGADDFAPILLLYVDKPCVVIGKNQVPWRECATVRLRADGVPLARRISGGGTVYHDEGNLNYSFIVPRNSYSQDEIFATILRALDSLGIEAHAGANNGLFIGERKFSGTAFCYRRRHVLHHGTLLVSTDLDKLRRYCAPALPQISTRAIASKPASVMNLSEVRTDLDAEILSDAILSEIPNEVLFVPDPAPIQKRASELRAWEFLWGHSPAFEIQIGAATLRIEHGHIAAAPFPELRGLPFDRGALREKLPIIGKEAADFFQSLEMLEF